MTVNTETFPVSYDMKKHAFCFKRGEHFTTFFASIALMPSIVEDMLPQSFMLISFLSNEARTTGIEVSVAQE